MNTPSNSKALPPSSLSSKMEQPVRVLVVDDSAFLRFTLTNRLNNVDGISVLAAAHDGKEALELIPALKPDVITLDIEMPHMDGLTTLQQIMAKYPTPVIMVSNLTTEGSRETIKALTYGAVDFIAKPSALVNIETIIDDLIAKIQRAANAHVFPVVTLSSGVDPKPNSTNPKQTCLHHDQDKVVVIGSSTGGPRALNTVINQLSAQLPASFLIVQHMPVGFTRSLAERLNSTSNLLVKEAEPGDTLKNGQALVAPGGFHMVLDENNKIALNQNPTIHGVRPAVDATLLSVAQKYGKSTIAVILTGMGNDGTNGAILVHSLGGKVIIEDESTCVVWGMPRSVWEAKAADDIVPLPDIAKAIERVL